MLTCTGSEPQLLPPQPLGVINCPDISAEIHGLVGTTEQGSKAIRDSGTLMQMLI